MAYDHLKVAGIRPLTPDLWNAVIDAINEVRALTDRKVNRDLDSNIVPIQDGVYDIGSSTRRLHAVYALAVYAGDVVLGNRYAIAEDEKGPILVDLATGKRYRFLLAEEGVG